MRFEQIQKGTRARRRLRFPGQNQRCALLDPLPELEAQRAKDLGALQPADAPPESVAVDHDHVSVDVRVLNGDEEATALRRARDWAIAQGIEKPAAGEPLYDLAVMVETLALACVDVDSPESEPVPFFESAEQIRKYLDRERIAFLFSHYEVWQDECSPQVSKLGMDRFYDVVLQAANSADPSDPFVRLRPGTAAICFRTMASLLVRSQALKSSPGSSSEASTSESSRSPLSENASNGGTSH